MKVIPIDTPGTGTWARDCELICLSDSYLSDCKGFRVSYRRDEDDTYWMMHCETITAYKVISEELSTTGYLINLPADGAFYEILDSPWLAELGNKDRILSGYRHFVLQFYEETIEVIAKHLYFEQLKDKPEKSLY
jgi:hypothetical protein